MLQAKQFETILEMEKFLSENGVDTSLYGKGEAKTLENFFEEASSGETKIYLNKKTHQVVREVKVLNIHILHGDKKLQEVKQVFKDKEGNETERERLRDWLPVAMSEKMNTNESFEDGIKRGVREELGVILRDEQVEGYTLERKESESPSFPGIYSIYHLLTSSVEFDAQQYNSSGYIESQKEKNTYFKWKNRVKLEEK